MKKTIQSILVLCALALCGQGCDKSNTTAGDPAPKKYRLAFVTNTKNEFWKTVEQGCERAAQNLGDVDLDFRFLTNFTVEAQNKIVGALADEEDVDGIAISPIDAEKQTEFLNEIAARTLLVCVDSDAANSDRACFIGSDNTAAGQKAAELLKAALPEGGKVVVCVGHPDAENAKHRIEAIEAALADSNIKIVDYLVDKTEIDVARKNAKEALEEYPDLAGMVGIYSYNGPAILDAVRAAGKAGKVKIVCFDDDTATLNGIAAGDIYGTVIQISYRIGYETIKRMGDYVEGNPESLSEGKVLLDTFAVTQPFVDSIQVYRQNLLEP